MPGTDRQPSSLSSVPDWAMISGLMNTRSWSWVSEMSMTMTRSCTSTWVAASPMPGAAYMVSAMSSTSVRMRSSTAFTGLATVCRRASG